MSSDLGASGLLGPGHVAMLLGACAAGALPLCCELQCSFVAAACCKAIAQHADTVIPAQSQPRRPVGVLPRASVAAAGGCLWGARGVVVRAEDELLPPIGVEAHSRLCGADAHSSLPPLWSTTLTPLQQPYPHHHATPKTASREAAAAAQAPDARWQAGDRHPASSPVSTSGEALRVVLEGAVLGGWVVGLRLQREQQYRCRAAVPMTSSST